MHDIHTHLYWQSYDEDREAVLARAKEAGVERIFVVGTTLEESQKAIELAVQHADIFASVGMHPNEFRHGKSVSKEWFVELTKLSEHPRVVAIGECGLDYSESHGKITENEKQAQKEAVIAQLALAQKRNLPVIVHCRTASADHDDAYRDLLAIVERVGQGLQGIVLHCYMGDTEVTREFLKLPNIYFSFTGNITYPVKKNFQGTKDDLTETVRLVPLERIFTETDCPFLAPQSKRGTRNEPAFVVEVTEKICALKGVSLEAFEKMVSENVEGVFLRGLTKSSE